MKVAFVIIQDHETRVTLRRELERHGFAVHSAANRLDADSLLSSGLVPNYVLLDSDNPALPVAEFLVALRSSPQFGQVPVVELSSREGGHCEDAWLRFRKPFKAADVVKQLATSEMERQPSSADLTKTR